MAWHSCVQGLRALSGVLLLRDNDEDDELAYEDTSATGRPDAAKKKAGTLPSLLVITGW